MSLIPVTRASEPTSRGTQEYSPAFCRLTNIYKLVSKARPGPKAAPSAWQCSSHIAEGPHPSRSLTKAEPCLRRFTQKILPQGSRAGSAVMITCALAEDTGSLLGHTLGDSCTSSSKRSNASSGQGTCMHLVHINSQAYIQYTYM